MQNVVFGLTSGSIYALIALGFSLVFKTSGILSFAHPQIMMISSLLGYTAMSNLGFPYPAAAVVCAAVSVEPRLAKSVAAVVIDSGAAVTGWSHQLHAAVTLLHSEVTCVMPSAATAASAGASRSTRPDLRLAARRPLTRPARWLWRNHR